MRPSGGLGSPAWRRSVRGPKSHLDCPGYATPALALATCGSPTPVSCLVRRGVELQPEVCGKPAALGFPHVFVNKLDRERPLERTLDELRSTFAPRRSPRAADRGRASSLRAALLTDTASPTAPVGERRIPRHEARARVHDTSFRASSWPTTTSWSATSRRRPSPRSWRTRCQGVPPPSVRLSSCLGSKFVAIAGSPILCDSDPRLRTAPARGRAPTAGIPLPRPPLAYVFRRSPTRRRQVSSFSARVTIPPDRC